MRRALLLTCLLPSITLCATPPTPTELSSKFDRILDIMWQNAEKKVSSDFAPLIKKDIADVKACFAKIASIFSSNKSFRTLFTAIITIDKSIKQPNHLRPKHIRWLKHAIANLPPNMTAQPQIKYFIILLSKYILPCFSVYTGTSFEKTVDSFVRQPLEFCGRNWWWLIPTTAATGYALYKGIGKVKNWLVPAAGIATVVIPTPQPQPQPPAPQPIINPIPPAMPTRSSRVLREAKCIEGPRPAPVRRNPYQQDGTIRSVFNGRFYNRPILKAFIRGQVENNAYVQGLHHQELANHENNPDVYSVCARPSLNQRIQGPCPYYALYNLLCLHENHGNNRQLQQVLLDRDIFDPLHQAWVNHTGIPTWLDNGQIQDLIRNQVPELVEDNLIRENISIITYFSNREASLQGMDRREFYGPARPLIANILRFRRTGAPQYLYIFTGHGGTNDELHGIHFGWDRAYGPCTGRHTIAAKIEWTGAPMQSRIIITVLDSYLGVDNRYARLIHWLHHLFVHHQV